MKTFRFAGRYKRDFKRISRRGYDLGALNVVLDTLADGKLLPAAYLDHTLKGDWKGHRECHIEPDWLLIYQADDDEVLLARTGTHADLFGK